MQVRTLWTLLLIGVGGGMLAQPVPAAEPAADQTIALGSGLKMTVPGDWVAKKPRIAMISHEFAVPAVPPDKEAGRVTVMTAGGSVEANVERWIGQFAQPDGSATKEKAKIEKKEIAKRTVTLVDVSGTYHDSRGPGMPVVDRPGYRMLAAVIPASENTYFVKFYGPAKTVEHQAAAFRRMIEGLSGP